MDAWANLIINSIGAVAVAISGLLYLHKRDVRDREKDKQDREHVEKICDNHLTQTSELMGYIKERDKMSKEIADSGHDGLREVTAAINDLRSEIRSKDCFKEQHHHQPGHS